MITHTLFLLYFNTRCFCYLSIHAIFVICQYMLFCYLLIYAIFVICQYMLFCYLLIYAIFVICQYMLFMLVVTYFSVQTNPSAIITHNLLIIQHF